MCVQTTIIKRIPNTGLGGKKNYARLKTHYVAVTTTVYLYYTCDVCVL